MNSIQACFILGLVIGTMIAGYTVWKIEEEKILILQNQQQKVLNDAQAKVIVKQQQGNDITQKVVSDYENKLFGINNVSSSLPAGKNSTHGVSEVSQSSSRSYATCKLRLTYLQEWMKEQVASFNK